MNDKENDMKPKMEDKPVLKEFKDIFLEEVLGLLILPYPIWSYV